jgi:hypothetical protein
MINGWERPLVNRYSLTMGQIELGSIKSLPDTGHHLHSIMAPNGTNL